MTRSSLSRILILVRRERTELFRDPIALAIIGLIPLVTLALFTFALATDVREMPLAVFDGAGSARSRGFVQAIESTRYFDVRIASSLEEVTEKLESGEIGALLVIPPDVESRFAHDQVAEAQLILDGAQAILAANAESILSSLGAEYGQRVSAARAFGEAFVRRDGEPRGGLTVEPHGIFNPRLDSEHFMIPGLLGYIFTFLTIMVAAISIVRERMLGTFEQLVLTPVAPGEIIAAKLIVLGIAMLVDEALVVLAGGALFGVWPAGSVFLLVGATVLYLLVTLSIGLLISAGSPTVVDAIQKALVVATPLLNVSGLVFPVTFMPAGFRVFAKVLPVYHYLKVSRAIYLTDAGLRALLPDLGVIAAWLVLLTLLLRRRLAKVRQS